MDHMRRNTLHLDAVRLVVLDEADVMLDMGFRDDIETILQEVPKERQTVFFSATMPRPIQDLIQRYARDPANVRIEQETVTVPTVNRCITRSSAIQARAEDPLGRYSRTTNSRHRICNTSNVMTLSSSGGAGVISGRSTAKEPRHARS